MSYIILFILLIFSVFVTYKNPLKIEVSRNYLLVGWGLKLAFATLFILIHTYYYSKGHLYGDVANFFNDGEVLANYAKKDFSGYLNLMLGFNSNDLNVLNTDLADTNIWSYGDNGDFINDNRLIIRINSIIHLFSMGNIWIHTLFFAFISYVGTLLIYKSFVTISANKKLLFLGLFTFPTLMFWGSGISKECLLTIGIGLFFYGIYKLSSKINVPGVLILLAGILILIFNKTHVGLVLIPLSLILLYLIKTGVTKIKIVVILGVVMSSLITFSFTAERLNFVSKISKKQSDLLNLAQGGVYFVTDTTYCAFEFDEYHNFEYNPETNLIKVIHAAQGEYKINGEGEFYPYTVQPSETLYPVYFLNEPSKSFVPTTAIDNSGIQMLKNTPSGLINVFLRPFPTRTKNYIIYILFAENLTFLALIILTLFKRRPLDDKSKSWLVYLLISAILITLIIGWTTPIIGAVVRYKMASYLLLLIAISIYAKPFFKTET